MENSASIKNAVQDGKNIPKKEPKDPPTIKREAFFLKSEDFSEKIWYEINNPITIEIMNNGISKYWILRIMVKKYPYK